MSNIPLNQIITAHRTGPEVEGLLKKNNYLSVRWIPAHGELGAGIAMTVIIAVFAGGVFGGAISADFGVHCVPFKIGMGIMGASLFSAAIMISCLAYYKHEYDKLLSQERIEEFMKEVQHDLESRQKTADAGTSNAGYALNRLESEKTQLQNQKNEYQKESSDLQSKLNEIIK